jgi:hypothetical protein
MGCCEYSSSVVTKTGTVVGDESVANPDAFGPLVRGGQISVKSSHADRRAATRTHPRNRISSFLSVPLSKIAAPTGRLRASH